MKTDSAHSTALLTLPAKTEKVVQPKPTRNELITAMALRKIENTIKERDELQITVTRLKKECEVAVRNHAARVALAALKSGEGVQVGLGWFNKGETSNLNVTLSLDNLPEPLRKLVNSYHAAYHKHVYIPTLIEAKREIRAKMDGQLLDADARIKKLLEDAGTSKAIDAALRELEQAPKAITV